MITRQHRPLSLDVRRTTDPGFSTLSAQIIGLDDMNTRLLAIGRYVKDYYSWGDIFRKRAQKVLEDATSTWTNQPTFETEQRARGSAGVDIALRIRDHNAARIFGYVDRGTRAHLIRPRWNNKSGVLAFPSRFRPKSHPNSLRAYKGFRGGKTVIVRSVQHPGTAPRNFTRLAAEKAQREGSAQVRQSIINVYDGRPPLKE